MKINYGFASVEGEGSVFLRSGNLLCYLPNDVSYYFGISILDKWNEPIKIIDSLIQEYEEVFVGKNFAEFYNKGKKSTISISDASVIINSETECNIDLDFRRIYDFSTEGRYYAVKEKKGIKIIECVQSEKKYYLGIKGDIHLIEEWVEKNYPYDLSRKDTGKAWVHRIAKGKNFQISFGETESKAIKNLCGKIKKKNYSDMKDLLNLRKNQLIHEERIIAGLPWFFQAWTRDELISLEGYNKQLRKKILMNYLTSLRNDGRLPNRLPHADLGSADSTGLYAFNIRKNLMLFNNKEKEQLLNFFIDAKNLLEKNYSKKGLIMNNPKETWMDTIPREGINIEIQALHMNLLTVIEDLGGKTFKEEFLKNVRKEFNEKIDNIDDEQIRPNIFLAYYYYPELFDEKTWKSKFSEVIKECWQEWGGLTTISKNSWLYHPFDEGKTDESYHNGNSWYFINNISAICMLDFPELIKYAKKIYEASKKELLSSGLLGCSAEISSAEQLQSRGCMFQAWSITTLLELHEKITSYNYNESPELREQNLQ